MLLSIREVGGAPAKYGRIFRPGFLPISFVLKSHAHGGGGRGGRRVERERESGGGVGIMI